jgi:uncharacterized membrane protein YkoI
MVRTLTVTIAMGLLTAGALAQTPSGTAPSGSGRTGDNPAVVLPQPGQVLSEGEIKAKLQEEGYSEVTELQLQGPSYEAKALKDGRKYNLTVDARTGNIRSRY